MSRFAKDLGPKKAVTEDSGFASLSVGRQPQNYSVELPNAHRRKPNLPSWDDLHEAVSRDVVDTLPPEQISHTAFGKRAYVTAGVGKLTVILESGLGHGKAVWAKVFNAISPYTRVVAYDRAGYGHSERSHHPRDGIHMVEELRAMLAAEHIAPPYVLVGHSLGGTLMKLFAKLHPWEVEGMVLLDARDSDLSAHCREHRVNRNLVVPPKAMRMLARPVVRAELEMACETARQARRVSKTFPQVPIMVMTQRRTMAHWPASLAEAWKESQRSMVTLSKIRGYRVCHNAGHNLHKEEPEIVIRNILKTVEAAHYRMKRKSDSLRALAARLAAEGLSVTA